VDETNQTQADRGRSRRWQARAGDRAPPSSSIREPGRSTVRRAPRTRTSAVGGSRHAARRSVKLVAGVPRGSGPEQARACAQAGVHSAGSRTRCELASTADGGPRPHEAGREHASLRQDVPRSARRLDRRHPGSAQWSVSAAPCITPGSVSKGRARPRCRRGGEQQTTWRRSQPYSAPGRDLTGPKSGPDWQSARGSAADSSPAARSAPGMTRTAGRGPRPSVRAGMGRACL